MWRCTLCDSNSLPYNYGAFMAAVDYSYDELAIVIEKKPRVCDGGARALQHSISLDDNPCSNAES